MNKICVVFLVLATGLCFAGDEKIGTTVMPLFKVGFGPRAAALGEAYVAMANDIGAVWWNPAGLDQLNTGDALAAHHEWFQGVRDEYLGVVYPTSPRSTWGGGIVFSTVTGIEHWNDQNYPIGTITTFSGIPFVSYARRLTKVLSVGGGAKFAYENLYDASGLGGALDLGVHYRPRADLRFGLAAQNLGLMFYSGQTWTLPSALRAGAAYTYGELGTALLDVNYSLTEQIPSVHFGIEGNINPMFAVRLGYRTGPVDLARLGLFSGLTAGFGVHYEQYHIDAAYSQYGYLGPTLRLAAGMTFGERPTTGALIVKVIDGETRQPLAADLTLTGLRKKKVTTDTALGRFSAVELPKTLVTVAATRKDYYPTTDSVKVVPPDTAVLVIELSKVPPGIVTGRIYDVKTNLPLVADVAYAGFASGTVSSAETDGNYTSPKLHHGAYRLEVVPRNPKYFGQTADVGIEPAKTTVKDFGLLRAKEVITLRNVNFATGTDSLLPESYPVLDSAAQILLDNPKIAVELGGHTDIRRIHSKDFPDNFSLSQRRAEAVKRYLVEKFSVDPNRLVAKGYGSTQPMASNLTEDGMALNRRTEFRVLGGTEYYQEIKR